MHERRVAIKHLTGIHYRPILDRAGDIVYVERLRHYYGGKSLLDHISADAYARADGAGVDDSPRPALHADDIDTPAHVGRYVDSVIAACHEHDPTRYLDLATDSDGFHHCPSDPT